MVDAIGIKVLRHLAESLDPPRASVGQHGVPVIGGESPVLSVGRERIGWCTGLPVEIEVARLDPCLDPVAADADGDVALENHLPAAGIVVCAAHLTVQAVLDEVPERHLAVDACAGVAHGSNLMLLEGVVVGPVVEACRAIEVTVVAECRIGYQPAFVGLEECLEVIAVQHLGPLLGKYLSQITEFGLVDALIVNLRQGIQFLAQGLIVLGTRLVGQWRQLAQVAILRVQGIDADAVVGVTVLPGVCDGRVVDGQHLQGTLPCHGHPVDHALEVAEVAHPEAVLAAQREDWDHCAGNLDRWQCKVGLLQLIGHHVASPHGWQHHGAVVSILPDARRIVAEDDKLKLDELRAQLHHIERHDPLVAQVFGHGHCLTDVPVAQQRSTAHHGQTLAPSQLRCAHLQLHGHRVGGVGQLAQVSPSHTVGHGRAVEIGILGQVIPSVIGRLLLPLAGIQVQAVWHHSPLVTRHMPIAHHAVVVVQRPWLGGQLQFTLPGAPVGGAHGMLLHLVAACDLVQHQILAILCAIIQPKFQFHIVVLIFW